MCDEEYWLPLEEDPNLQDGDTEYSRGMYHYDRKEYQQALSAFEMAAAYGHETAWTAISDCYLRMAMLAADQRDWQEAERLLERSALSRSEKQQIYASWKSENKEKEP